MLWSFYLLANILLVIEASYVWQKKESNMTPDEKERLALLIHYGADYSELHDLLAELCVKYGSISRDLESSIEGIPLPKGRPIQKSSSVPIRKTRSLPLTLNEELEPLDSSSSSFEDHSHGNSPPKPTLTRSGSPSKTLPIKSVERPSTRRISGGSSDRTASPRRKNVFNKSNPEKQKEKEGETRPSRSSSSGSTFRNMSKKAITSKGREISLHPKPERSSSLFNSLAAFSPNSKRAKDENELTGNPVEDTFIIRALQYGLLEHVMVLFTHGAQLHELSIHAVCKNPFTLDAAEKLKLLLSLGGVPYVNSHDDDGNTPMHLVMQNMTKDPVGSIDLLRLLLDNAANPDIPDDDDESPLQYFMRKLYWSTPRRNEVLGMLLETANPNQALSDGRDLMAAVEKKHCDYYQLYEARKMIYFARQRQKERLGRIFSYPHYPSPLAEFNLRLNVQQTK